MQEHMSSSLAETIQIQAAYFQLRRARWHLLVSKLSRLI